MKLFLLIVFILVTILTCFITYANKFKNPYQIEFFIGVRGAGKSTLATKEAIKFMQAGHKVYSNFEVFGAYRFNAAEDLGRYYMAPGSLILCDEVSLIWSNRTFKEFPVEVERFCRYARKYKVYLRFYSQNFDCDKKIRGLVDSIYILIKLCNVFTLAKRVKRTIVLHSATDDSTGERQSEGFVSENFSYDLPTTWKVAFIPRWIKFFNSFEAPELPHKEFKKYTFINEPYMYRLTHYRTYKVEQLKELYLKFRTYLKRQYLSFDIGAWDFYNNRIQGYNSSFSQF